MKAHIYHEQQESSLCGQHCLNNLLQGPHFSAVDLGEIANGLDQQERLLGGINNYHESANVDDSGNFSIQVLRCALQRYCGADLVTWFHKSGEKDIEPTEKKGFVVNRSEHWFTIRKIRDTWWNLNSTNERPDMISPFYLSAFLGQLRADGYSVFFVDGKIPDEGDPNLANEYLHKGSGHWYSEEELLRPSGARGGTVAQPPAFQAFQGKGRRLVDKDVTHIQDLTAMDSYDEELELAKAISASLEPAIPSTAAGTVASSGKDDVRARRLAALSKMGIN